MSNTMILPAAASLSRSGSSSYSLGMMSVTKSLTANKSLVKLNAEVQKLKAIIAYTNADAEEKLEQQRDTMNTLIAEVESKLRCSVEEHDCVRMEIAAKEDAIKADQNRHEETEKKLKMIEIENEELYEQLNDIINEQEENKTQRNYIGQQMETVKAALNDMLIKQESIALMSKKDEEMLKIQSDSRMAALYKFLEEEGQRRKILAKSNIVSELNETICEITEKQRTYLRSTCSLLSDTSKHSDISLEQYRINEGS